MIKVKVTVTGLGGCIFYEADVIRRAFEGLGYDVSVTSKFDSHDIPFPEKPDEFYSRRTEQLLERVKAGEHPQLELTIIHQPWGG